MSSFRKVLIFTDVVQTEVKNILDELIRNREIPKLEDPSASIDESINMKLREHGLRLHKLNNSRSQVALSQETKYLIIRNIEVMEFRIGYLESLVNKLEAGIEFMKKEFKTNDKTNDLEKFEYLDSLLLFTESYEDIMSPREKYRKMKLRRIPIKKSRVKVGGKFVDAKRSQKESFGNDVKNSRKVHDKWYCTCSYKIQKGQQNENLKVPTNAHPRTDQKHNELVSVPLKPYSDSVPPITFTKKIYTYDNCTQQRYPDVFEIHEAVAANLLNKKNNSNIQFSLEQLFGVKKVTPRYHAVFGRYDSFEIEPNLQLFKKQSMIHPFSIGQRKDMGMALKLRKNYIDEGPSTSAAAARQSLKTSLSKNYTKFGYPMDQFKCNKVISHCLISTGSLCYVSKIHRLKDEEKSATITNFNLDVALQPSRVVSQKLHEKLVNSLQHGRGTVINTRSNESKLILRRSEKHQDIPKKKYIIRSAKPFDINKVCYERPFSNSKGRYITDRVYRANMLTYKQSKTAHRLMGLLE